MVTIRILTLALLAISIGLGAPAQHALIVGIDVYAPAARNSCPLLPKQKQRGFAMHSSPRIDLGCPTVTVPDLKRSVADAKEFQDLLMARFGFTDSTITPLFDQKATASAILGNLDVLIDSKLKAGDSLVFYFAGHGVHVRNTQGQNLQQALVPFDYLIGAYPILDVELIARYKRAVARKIRITVVLDSCYSGGVSRGEGARSRSLQMDNRTVNLVPPIPPAEREFALLASAHPGQRATDSPTTFTQALVRIVTQNIRDLSLDDIARATAPDLGAQVPFADGAGRNQTNAAGQTLERGLPTYVVSGIDRLTDAPVQIPNGKIQGMTVGSEFILEGQIGKRFKVETVELTQSWLSLVGHNAMPDAGNKLTLTHWAPPTEGPTMVVHIPADLPENKDVAALRACLSSTEPASEAERGTIILWANGGWRLSAAGAADEAFSCDAAKRAGHVRVNLPPTRELLAGLSKELSAHSAFLQNQPGASFAIIGRLQDGRLEYALAARSPVVTKMLPAISKWNQDWYINDNLRPSLLPVGNPLDCVVVPERCALYLGRRIRRSNELLNLVRGETLVQEMITREGMRPAPWKLEMRKTNAAGTCTTEPAAELDAGSLYCLVAAFTGTASERNHWYLNVGSIDGAGLVWQETREALPPFSDTVIAPQYSSTYTEDPAETLFLIASNDAGSIRDVSQAWQACPPGECRVEKGTRGRPDRPGKTYSIQLRTYPVKPVKQ